MRRALLALCLASAACEVTTVESPAGLARARPAISTPHRAWEVVAHDAAVGILVEFRATGPGSQRFFSVRNPYQQELGMVDGAGRAWRFHPHGDDAEWLGSGTVDAGAARILGIAGTLELIEVPLERLRRAAQDAATRAD